MKINWFCIKLLVVGITASIAWNANATVTMKYEGACDSGCTAVGLTPADSISATFKLGVAGPDFSNLSLSKTDVASFSLDIGTINFTSADTSNWDFALSTGGASTITSFYFLASLASGPDFGETVDLRLGPWFAAPSGQCNNVVPVPCDFSQTGSYFFSDDRQAIGSGSASFFVPEPTTLALMLPALLVGVAAVRRKKFVA